MRDKIGLFVLEAEDGEVSVQLFGDIDNLKTIFPNLVKTHGDKGARATMLCLEFGEGQPVVVVDSKMLPVEPIPVDERPDGKVVGGDPVFLPKKESEESDSEKVD